MSDFDDVKKLLEYLEIPFSDIDESPDKRQEWKQGEEGEQGFRLVANWPPDSRKVVGYSAFYCDWIFDADGKFLRMEI